MNSTIFKYLAGWVILVLVQVLLLNHIQISGFINPYLYVLFILILPFNTPKYLLLLIGFFMGLSIDIFSNTIGIHASATTFLAFVRPFVINLISGRDILESNTAPRISELGLNWFLRYAVVLVLIHHFFLFYVEVFTLHGFIFTFLRALLSSFFTVILVILSQYITYNE